MATQALNAVVTQRVDLAPGLMIMRVAPLQGQISEFSAGQFTVLGLPGSAPRVEGSDPEETPPDPEKLIRRSYSIASSSRDTTHLEFYINLVASGELTPRLFALKAGDPLWLGPKITGLFTLRDVPAGGNLVLISTGTGLAPYMSMLRGELMSGRFRRIAVIHGARHSRDLGYSAELTAMDRLWDSFDYFPIVSRPEMEIVPWTGLTGRVQSVWLSGELEKRWGEKPSPENTHVFLCGSPAMIEETLQLLGQEGFREHTRKEPGQVHLERYW